MIAVSIVTYHTPDRMLKNCLSSLANKLVGRIVVVDNSSDASTRRLVEGYGGVEYLANPNVGYGRAHNIPMAESVERGYDYHLVLNPDVSFDPEVISRLCEFLDANRSIAMAQPAMKRPDGSDVEGARMLPTPLDLIARRFLPRFMFRRRRERYLLRHLSKKEPFRVPYVQGSFMMIRCSALKETGLFDPRYFMYPEDIDLSRRLDERYGVACVPGIVITHDHAAGSYRSLSLLKVHIINMCRYFNKWGWWHDPIRRRLNSLLRSGKYEFSTTPVIPSPANMHIPDSQ